MLPTKITKGKAETATTSLMPIFGLPVDLSTGTDFTFTITYATHPANASCDVKSTNLWKITNSDYLFGRTIVTL